MKVRLNFFLLLFISILMILPVQGQNKDNRWNVGYGFAFRDFSGLPDFSAPSSRMLPAYTLQVGRYLNKALDVGLQGSLAPFPTSTDQPFDNLKDVGALLKLKIINGDWAEGRAALMPYLQTGFGAAFAGPENDIFTFLPAGLGVKVQSRAPVSLDVFANYHIGLGDLPSYVTLGGGINFAFGGGAVEEEPEEEPIEMPKDTDGDGIVDADDDCPNQAGLATFKGCPDTDGDGVADKDDNCPEVVGLISLQGCPEEKPDSDGDGIIDEDDDCPNAAGLATYRGCPDTDEDGIIDKEDDCPEIAGLPEFDGCPDSDGDGIRDIDDRCPEVAGVAEMQGCPEVEEEVKEKLARVTKNVKFKTGSDELLESSKTILNEIVSIMEEYPEYSLKIDGHTDNVGDDVKNQTLSESRARACLLYLQEKGVDLNRMEAAGYGEEIPIGDNNTAAGRAQNRRVDFELFVK
jgi:OOP family OmpA-OmpF porin